MPEDPRVVYADIINLPHHRSAVHPHMSLHDRAAQFAPFAALVGYDEMVDEEARLTDRRVDPGESDLERLDRIFAQLSAALARGERPPVSLLVFVPDSKKSGGRYETVSGKARRLDPVEKKLFLLDSSTPPREIPILLDRILDAATEL